MDKNYDLYRQAKAAGKAVAGFFRLDGRLVRATWSREFPGCYIAGQGGCVWSLRDATPEEERLVKDRWGL